MSTKPIQDFPKFLNVGCGYDKRTGFLNVDMDPNCQPDLLIKDNDFSVLPRRYFDKLIAYDVLEHIHRSETPNALLEWADLMSIDAQVEVETSNVLAIVDLMRANNSYANHANCTIYMYGNQMHAGDYHLTGFTEITLRVQMAAAGFEIDSFIHHMDWILLAKGRKVEDWAELVDTGTHLSNSDFIVAAYEAALFRSPEEPFHSMEVGWLDSGEKDRRAILKKLYASDERRLKIAATLGY